MADYQRLSEPSSYSPPWNPRRNSADLSSNELEPLDSNEHSLQSHNSDAQTHSRGGIYSYTNDPEATSSYDIAARPRPSDVQENDSYYRYSNAPDLEDDGRALVDKDLPVPESYQTYKRRWIGLAVLTLFNLAIGWGGAAPGVVSTTATQWYSITYPQLNNLAIATSLVFLVSQSCHLFPDAHAKR